VVWVRIRGMWQLEKNKPPCRYKTTLSLFFLPPFSAFLTFSLIFLHVSLPTTHSPSNILEPSSFSSHSFKIPVKPLGTTFQLTGVIIPSFGTGRNFPTSNTFRRDGISERCVWAAEARIMEVNRVIESGHEGRGGPTKECDKSEVVREVAEWCKLFEVSHQKKWSMAG
jgi:hypothetical protein